jgi:hypothetical protein
MLTLSEGTLAIARAAQSVPADAYGRIVVAIRADHDARYGCREFLWRVFGPKVEERGLERRVLLTPLPQILRQSPRPLLRGLQ